MKIDLAPNILLISFQNNMKQLLITFAAVVLVGCGPPKAPDITIHDAANDGNIEAVKQHLADGADVNAMNRHGDSPLHLAAQMGHKEIVELLIAKGADVNAKGPQHKSTPLHSAVGGNHKEVAELLIAKGADVNAKDQDDETPLDWAIHGKLTEIADLLRKHGGKTAEELKAAGN